ncbi:MAG: hypothetical protein Q8867_11445, partial [Bacteroidota bacterium]|nr:hypothetical protein [Bacteroidota bacterium]
MSQVQSLIMLVNSMSLPEKKAFRIKLRQGRTQSNYLVLYNLIEKNGSGNISGLKNQFRKERPGAAFETSARYLYNMILSSLLSLNKDHDNLFSLFNLIFSARILYEKSMFTECFNLLQEAMSLAEKYENYYAFLLASRMELEYLLALN